MSFMPGPTFVLFKYTGIHMGDPGHLLEASVVASGEIAAEYFPVGADLRVPLNLGAIPDITKPLERVVDYLLIPGQMVP